MRTDTPTITYLENYRPSDYLIDSVELDISLHETETRVRSKLSMRPNPAGGPGAALVLDGDELVLTAIELNGAPLEADRYEVTPQSLTISHAPSEPFVLMLETLLNPSTNTKLMGLYRSSGVYCTQCEADGFRRITYFLDRPDVMSVYTTRLEAEIGDAPILLGNGNPTEKGEIEGTGRHFSIWYDPFPKPAYLFAVVGGHLDRVGKDFTTMTGRSVEIAVYGETGKAERAHYALDALERSMRWDEDVFGREYDLDVFNVVAVSDFNMGAMENKGLNIFNDKYVLASGNVATDSDYAGIEAVIAHEYFHNWTGNRITCHDWFQLCLKEGLTVFRDQEFSSDQRSRAVHRISEIKTLRSRQFPEDAGPLAHPVRPSQYREINNFYTATVYEKGAEIVRMLKTLIGDDAFRRGMDIYFDRCDGTAATVEDFIAAFEQSSGRDLAHFARWYAQAGTPRVTVKGHYDAEKHTYRLNFNQLTSPTPGQEIKEPMVIPVTLGLVTEAGETAFKCDRLDERGVFTFDKAEDSILFTGLLQEPTPSIFRDFSAPVKISLDLDNSKLLTLLRHDSDAFNRWQSAQTVASRILVRMIAGEECSVETQCFIEALHNFLRSEASRDPAFAALVLMLPGENDIAQEIARDIDPDRIFSCRNQLRRQLATQLSVTLKDLYGKLQNTSHYTPDASSASRRSLANLALDLIACANSAEGEKLAATQFACATNMTDRLAALSVLSHIPGETRENALIRFSQDNREEPLAIDKWFALQAAIPETGVLERMERLMEHPAFSLSNPNRVRSVVGSFSMANSTQFHRIDGKGYAFLADIILKLDAINPQIAARLMTAFGPWRTMEAGRRRHAEHELRRIASEPDLSRDTSDIVQRTIG